MLRTKFIPTVLVIILSVNLGAWTLSVAMSPVAASSPLTVPIGGPAIDAQSQAASVVVAQPTTATIVTTPHDATTTPPTSD
ncbi:MAG TPA: hypothetical protein VMU13_02125 [Candidatus Paceibacterota bacterium]|nr:hypothetical protein [Candidatus Paceibacterota bacterium]